nr:hypothetical protein [uncultured Devosia sp.]
MLQFDFRSRNGTLLVDAYFAESIDAIPETFRRNLLYPTLAAPTDYWQTAALLAEVSRKGYASISRYSLVEKTKPRPRPPTALIS